jgi:hypothetical protein
MRSFFWAYHLCGYEARLTLDLNPHPLKCTKGAAPGFSAAKAGQVRGWVRRRFRMGLVASNPRGLGDRGYRVWPIMFVVFGLGNRVADEHSQEWLCHKSFSATKSFSG